MEKREIYQQKAEAKLEQLNARIDMLKAQTKESKADAQLEWQQRVDDLTEKRQDLRQRLDKIGDASEDAWDELSKGLDQAFGEIQEAVDQAGQKLEKVAN